MIVTLIGYRGCGKSSVGPLLAQRLGCHCVDSDDEIERTANRSIQQIFADSGETEFRRLESETLAELLQHQSLVIAAGGGAVLAEINRQRMRAAGPVVWLDASVDVLASRIGGDAASSTRRPSLTGKSIVEEVAEVLEARRSLYASAATIVVDAGAGTPEMIADDIWGQLKDSDAGEKA